MQEQEKQDQTTAQWLFPKIFAVILAVFVVGFGVQTYFLVDALMPSDQMLMKCLTVFAFDGCALIYFIGKQYYPFKSEKSKHAVNVMFRVTFAGSALCTVLWMILSADHFQWSLVPSPLVFAAYVLVTFAVTINVLVFYYLWEVENAAKHAAPTSPRPARVEPASQPTQQPKQILPSPAQPPAVDMTALLSAMQKMASEAAQNAATLATQQMIDKLTIPAKPVAPAQPTEQEYKVNRPAAKNPETEQLVPFLSAPTAMKTNGNGANHP